MAVCKFWLQGNCKFGDKCRFDHPQKSSGSNNSSNQNNSGQGGKGGRGGQQQNNQQSNRNEPRFHLDPSIIYDDLTKERPMWILSAYGPGRQAPLQLFGGYPREMSFEELRLRHYELATSGNPLQAFQEAQQLVATAEEQMQRAINDPNGAVKYVADGEDQHPNRLDVCAAKENHLGPRRAVSIPQPITDIFGGQPAINPIPVFGQNSLVSQPPHPVSNTQPTSSFGVPSNLQTAAQAASTFGQPSQFALPASGFGQPINTIPAAQAQNAPLFGQPSNIQPFAQPASSFGQPAPGFGQPAPTNPFLAAQNQPSTQRQQPNPFIQARQQTSTSNPFQVLEKGSSLSGQLPLQPAFGSNLPGAPQPTQHRPTTDNDIRKDARGNLTHWRGYTVTYRDGDPCFLRSDGEWERIWFPDGVPTWQKQTAVPEGWWTEDVQQKYEYAMAHGTWEDGKMPVVMPKAEWTNWNF